MKLIPLALAGTVAAMPTWSIRLAVVAILVAAGMAAALYWQGRRKG
jgi:hypothetical protein